MKRFLIALTVCLPACSGEISDAELFGVYVANFRGDKATLSLKADHIYTHVIQPGNGQALENQGTWKTWYVSQPHTVVEFSNFRLVPSFGATKKVGWSTEIERTWLGRIQLCFDSDVGYCYVKQTKS